MYCENQLQGFVEMKRIQQTVWSKLKLLFKMGQDRLLPQLSQRVFLLLKWDGQPASLPPPVLQVPFNSIPIQFSGPQPSPKPSCGGGGTVANGCEYFSPPLISKGSPSKGRSRYKFLEKGSTAETRSSWVPFEPKAKAASIRSEMPNPGDPQKAASHARTGELKAEVSLFSAWFFPPFFPANLPSD